jgi:C-terminal peptidase prc
MRREKLELSPVYTSLLPYHTHLLGYIRLANFSQRAAADMRTAIVNLQDKGCEGFILDLRNNPGGLVRVGLDIARLWLPAESPILNVEGRTPQGETALVQQVVLEGGQAMTQLPLTVLLNGGSASASEILAGALRDNHRAQLIGDTTFGKGKIQSVFELADGSALFVTVAKYKTPNLTDIDKHGIRPDTACSPFGAASSPGGVPVTKAAMESITAQLTSDNCVRTAEAFLDRQFAASKTVGYEQEGSLPPAVADMMASLLSDM